MGFSLWLSRRMRLSGPGRSANATGVAIAVTGVALALIIMEFTVGIVTGFKKSITERVTGFESQVWVQPPYNTGTCTSEPWFVPDDTLMRAVAREIPGARTGGRFTQPGLIKTDSDFTAVYFVAYDRGHDYAFERSAIVEGSMPDYHDGDHSKQIVLSRATADAMGLATGDETYVSFFVNDAVKTRKLTVAGIYQTGFGDYDKTVAFADIGAMRSVAGAPDGAVTRLDIDGVAPDSIWEKAQALEDRTIDLYRQGYSKLHPVDNVQHTGMIYFNWLDLMDTNVVVIFILMICVAGFTLVSSMFIIILERIPTIGILRALGATKRQVRGVFINLSMRIVAIGMAIGNVVGLGLLVLQRELQVVPLDPEMYYMDHVPVYINWWHMLLLNAGVVAVTWLILVLPSRLASRISPAVTMRFE